MFKTILCFLIISILTLPTSCLATKIEDTTIADLFANVTYVALAKINNSISVQSEIQLCGHRYFSTVINGLKGISNGELLEFITLDGYSNDVLEIGSLYVVFLMKTGSEYTPIMSTNSYSQQRKLILKSSVGPRFWATGSPTADTGRFSWKSVLH